MSEPASNFWRETIAETTHGDGLLHLHIGWRCRDDDTGDTVDLGDGDAYALPIAGDAPIEISIDRNATDWYRTVHILWPDGTTDIGITARRMVMLGELLRRPAVAAALAAWADEDAAVDAARLARRQQEGGAS